MINQTLDVTFVFFVTMFGSVQKKKKQKQKQKQKNIKPVVSISKIQTSCRMGNGFIKLSISISFIEMRMLLSCGQTPLSV